MAHALWVEVLGSAAPDEQTYYWHRGSDEVCWEAPLSTRVVWAVDRDPASGELFYWNKETLESTWSLPPPPPRGLHESSPRGDGPPGSAPPARTRPSEWLSSRPGEAAARPPRAAGAAPSPGPPRARRGPREREGGGLRGLLASHAAAVPGVRDCTEEVRALLSDRGGGAVVLECERAVGLERLLPPAALLARPPECACGVAGFVILEVADSLHSAKAVVDSLGRHWRSLTQKSPRAQFATMVCAAPLHEHHVAEGSELRQRLMMLQERLSASAPAPLVVAAWRQQASGPSGGGGPGSSAVLGGGGASTSDEDELSSSSPGQAQRQDGWSAQNSVRDTGGLQDREEELVAEIAEFLQAGPREVQELASYFAVRFNKYVRESSGYSRSASRRSDGAFKRWLLSRGFQAESLTDKSGALIFAPAQPARGDRSCEGWPAPQLSSGDPDPARLHQKGERRSRVKACDAPVAPPGSEREARQLERDVVRAVASLGPTSISHLSSLNSFGPRFNAVFFRRAKVNDGSFKRWLGSLNELELVTDPEMAKYHGNNPTIVRIWVPPP